MNNNDWESLRKEGHLNGLRYQTVSQKDNSYTIRFRKMTGQTPGDITPEQFLP